MFLENKYTQYYYNLIYKTKLKSVHCEYTEKHHILPRCLGGNDTAENIVTLTAREHFVCHLLLRKMVVGDDKRKMLYAARMMSNQTTGKTSKRTYKVTSHVYEQIKKEIRKLGSSVETREKISIGNRGKTVSIETKRKLSQYTRTEETKRKISQYTRTEETRRKMSLAKKGKHLSENVKKKISISNKGRIMSKESIEKTRQAHIGAKRSIETKEKIREKRAKQVIKRKTWVLQDPIGQIKTIQNLKVFCKENQLGLSKLLETMKTKKPVECGFSTGWIIISAEYL